MIRMIIGNFGSIELTRFIWDPYELERRILAEELDARAHQKHQNLA